MPHFIIECSQPIIEQQRPEAIIETVYNTADATNLFAKGDIKVRINPYIYYNVGGDTKDFIHVFGNIMEGRTEEQKNNLSRSIVKALKEMFPETPIISINIRDFDKSGYCNKSMVE